VNKSNSFVSVKKLQGQQVDSKSISGFACLSASLSEKMGKISKAFQSTGRFHGKAVLLSAAVATTLTATLTAAALTEGFLNRSLQEAKVSRSVEKLVLSGKHYSPVSELKPGRFSFAMLEEIKRVDPENGREHDAAAQLHLTLNTLDNAQNEGKSSRIEIVQPQSYGFLMAGWPVLLSVNEDGEPIVSYIDRSVMQEIGEQAKVDPAQINIRNVVCRSAALVTVDWGSDLKCHDHRVLSKHGFTLGMK
jgi:hypothetical protein